MSLGNSQQQQSNVTPAGESDVLGWARHYVNQGIQPVPLHPRSKRPIADGWQNVRLTADDLPGAFSRGENIGILTGSPSDGLADVDKDCDEALAISKHFLPQTSTAFGRENQITHELFRLAPTDFPTIQFRDPSVGSDNIKGMLVELRGTGSQTMAPPSVHPDTGKLIEWYDIGDVRQLQHSELVKCVERLAAACLLARYWPPLGGRNHAALALAGALAHGGWGELEAIAFIDPIARFKGDAKTEEVKATYKRIREGKPATGQPTCSQIFDERIWNKIAEWLHIQGSKNSNAIEAPRPLSREIPPAKEFPVEALGPMLADTAAAIHRVTRAPLTICCQSVLATASFCVQGHLDVVLPTGDAKPASEFFITIAESGERKTSADERALQGVRQRESQLREEFAELYLDYINENAAWEKQRQQILSDPNNKVSKERKKQQLNFGRRGT